MNNSHFAALIPVPAFDRTKIYGLTIIERSVLALGKAGISDIWILTKEVGAIKEHLKKYDNLVKLHLSDSLDVSSIKQDIKNLNPSRIFVFKEPLVVDISVLEDLKKPPGEFPGTCTIGKEVILVKLEDFLDNEEALSFSPMVFGNRSCHAIHNKGELKAVKSRLIKNLKKTSDGWVSRNLNRPVSTRITLLLAGTGINANFVTCLVGVIAFSAAIFVLDGGYWNWLAGAAIYQMASILDGVDGEIARLKMSFSKMGQFLDTFFDFASMIAVLIALVISVQNPEHNQHMVIQKAGYVALAAGLGSISSLIIYNLRNNNGATFLIPYAYLTSNSSWAKFIKQIKELGKRELYIFLFLILAILGQFPLALIYVAVMACLTFLLSLQTHFSKPAA